MEVMTVPVLMVSLVTEETATVMVYMTTCVYLTFGFSVYFALESECDEVLDCQHFCIKTDDSFQCACQHGYLLDLDGRSCQGMLH